MNSRFNNVHMLWRNKKLRREKCFCWNINKASSIKQQFPTTEEHLCWMCFFKYFMCGIPESSVNNSKRNCTGERKNMLLRVEGLRKFKSFLLTAFRNNRKIARTWFLILPSQPLSVSLQNFLFHDWRNPRIKRSVYGFDAIKDQK